MPQTAGTMGHAEKSKCQDGAVRVQSRLNSYFLSTILSSDTRVWRSLALESQFGPSGASSRTSASLEVTEPG